MDPRQWRTMTLEPDTLMGTAQIAAEISFKGDGLTAPVPRSGEPASRDRRLLARLGHETLRAVAVWKMERFTNAEIAHRLGWVEQTVKRKLRVIRQLWAEEASADAEPD